MNKILINTVFKNIVTKLIIHPFVTMWYFFDAGRSFITVVFKISYNRATVSFADICMR